MKHQIHLQILSVLGLFAATNASAELLYTFNSDVEGFQNVGWQSGPAGWSGGSSIRQVHTAGDWQMQVTKEFDWQPGGGAANQQIEMQALANSGGRLSFDVMIDGSSFPAGASTWFQFHVVGNSDGAAGWTQKENIFTLGDWHNADDATLITLHIDQPFSYFGWEAGDSWFQLYTGSNSDPAVPVNFYLDNVRAYSVVPEPSTLALAGLGSAALLLARRRR